MNFNNAILQTLSASTGNSKHSRVLIPIEENSKMILIFKLMNKTHYLPLSICIIVETKKTMVSSFSLNGIDQFSYLKQAGHINILSIMVSVTIPKVNLC